MLTVEVKFTALFIGEGLGAAEQVTAGGGTTVTWQLADVLPKTFVTVTVAVFVPPVKKAAEQPVPGPVQVFEEVSPAVNEFVQE